VGFGTEDSEVGGGHPGGKVEGEGGVGENERDGERWVEWTG